MRQQKIFLFAFLCFSGFAKSQQAVNWDTLRSGFSCAAEALFTDTIDSLLYAGGNIEFAGGVNVNGICVWDGVKWDSLGAGFEYGPGNGNCGTIVMSIVKFSDTIYAGGAFTWSGTLPTYCIAKWDGVKWDTLPGKGANGSILKLKVYSNELYVCGGFDSLGGIPANRLGKFDGTNFYAIDDTTWGLNAFRDIAYYNGDVYAGGSFGSCLYKFDGIYWSVVGGGLLGSPRSTQALEVYNGELYVAGQFYQSAGNAGNHIQKWNGTSWNDVGGGFDNYVEDLRVRNGKLYASGGFTTAGGVSAKGVAFWDGVKWCGPDNTINSTVKAVEIYNGQPVIAGWFTQIDGFPYNRVARWTGGDWCTVGIGETASENATSIIFPNPAMNNFSIELLFEKEQEVQIIITDLLGKKLFDSKEAVTKGFWKKTFDITGFNNGVYFVSIKTSDKIFPQKLIISQ